MATCCCCIGLRTGCILIGIMFLLVDAASLVWSALALADKLEQPWPPALTNRFDRQDLRLYTWVVLAVAVVSVLCDLALLLAAGMRRRCGQLLWLVWNGLVLTLMTLLLLVLLGIAIWLLVDHDADEKLGLAEDSLQDIYDALTLSAEQRRQRQQQFHLALLIGAIVGLVVMAVVWGWYSAVDRNQRRLRHTTVIVKTQHVHTSRL